MAKEREVRKGADNAKRQVHESPGERWSPGAKVAARAIMAERTRIDAREDCCLPGLLSARIAIYGRRNDGKFNVTIMYMVTAFRGLSKCSIT